MSTEIRRHETSNEEQEAFDRIKEAIIASAADVGPIQMIAILAQHIGFVVAHANFDTDDDPMLSAIIEKNLNFAIHQSDEILKGKCE